MKGSKNTESRRVAVITGAAQGIGLCIAHRLVSDGLNVVLNDVPNKKSALDGLVGGLPEGRSVFVLGDAADVKHIEELVETAMKIFGRLDVFIANAGISFRASILDTTEADWERIMRVNTLSVFLAYKIAGKHMIRQGKGGRLIGACSVSGKRGFPMMGIYSASKFFVRGITQSAAIEFGRYGITVNAYAPGLIETPMMHNSIDDMGGKNSWVKKTADATALKTNGYATDIASLVSFLASEDSRFITGQSINANGGYVAFD